MDLTLTKVEGQTIPVSSLQMSPADYWIEKHELRRVDYKGQVYASDIETHYPNVGDDTTIDLDGMVFAGPNFDYSLSGQLEWDATNQVWDDVDLKGQPETGNDVLIKGDAYAAFLKIIAL